MKFILYSYLIIYYLRPAAWVNGMRYHWLLYIGVMGIICLVVQSVEEPQVLFNNKYIKYLLLFCMWASLSKVATGWAGGALVFIQDFMPALILYILIIYYCNTSEKLRKLLFLLTCLTLILCIHSIMQVVLGAGFGGLEPLSRFAGYSSDGVKLLSFQPRWYGVFSDPNDLGMALVALLPYVFHRALRLNVFYIISTVIVSTGIYCTNSRGTILAVIVGMSLYFVLRKKSVWGGGVAILFTLVLLAYGPSRMGEMNASETSSIGRIEAWYAGIEMLKSNPFLGVGPANFTENYYITAHNSYVLVAAETGGPGLLFFVGAVLAPLLLGVRLIFKVTTDIKRMDLLPILSGFCAICISIFFISRSYVALPYIFSAITLSTCQIEAKEIYDEVNATVSFKIICGISTLLLIFIILFLLLFL